MGALYLALSDYTSNSEGTSIVIYNNYFHIINPK